MRVDSFWENCLLGFPDFQVAQIIFCWSKYKYISTLCIGSKCDFIHCILHVYHILHTHVFTQYYCHTPLRFWFIKCPAPRLPSGGQRSETPKRSTTGWSCRRQGGTLRAIPHISKDHDDDGEEEDEEMIMLVIRVAMAMRKHAQPWYCELLLLLVWYALRAPKSAHDVA